MSQSLNAAFTILNEEDRGLVELYAMSQSLNAAFTILNLCGKEFEMSDDIKVSKPQCGIHYSKP